MKSSNITTGINAEKAMASIRSLTWKANSLASDEFDYWMEFAEDREYSTREEISNHVESAFLQLLTLTDSFTLRLENPPLRFQR